MELELDSKLISSRDSRISMRKYPRGYKIDDGSKKYDSVTTLLSKIVFFDQDKQIEKMKSSQSFSTGKYANKTNEEIKKEWAVLGTEGMRKGTLLHEKIETFLKGGTVILDHEFDKFVEWYDKSGLKPFRIEWMIFHEESRIAGCVDCVMKDENGFYHIFDWKRCKKYWTGPSEHCEDVIFSELPNTDSTKHHLQTNMYKYILETKYSMKIKSMNIVRIYPEEPIEIISSPDYQKEVSLFFMKRSNDAIDAIEAIKTS